MNRIAAVVAGLSLAFVGTSATIAATINVPGDQPTIAAAISASVNGDVINIAAGTYNEGNLNTGGKAITIQGTLNGDGSLATTIDAQQGGRVFLIDSGEGDGTVIKDLVITGGSASPGGGIFCYFSSPTISDCTITGNTSNNYGGGIYCNHGNPIISSCTISGNTASEDGGGIYCYFSSPTISDCSIEGNTASRIGGGIICWSDSSPDIINCDILDNEALNGSGGGIWASGGSSPTITFCKISNNTSNDPGGGIYCGNGSPTIGDVVVCGNWPDQIVNNYVDAGGNFVDEDCTIPEGACCVGGTCSVQTEADCVSSSGTYLGDGSDCMDDPCYIPPVEGACCSGNDCSITFEDDCGGTWLGEGIACNDITCFAGAIYVPGDYATIQGAIDASVNGDVIAIAAGTYYESELNTSGKAITIQGTLNGDGSLATTIDAQQGGRVFLIDSGEGDGTVIKDLVITGGSAYSGGGIACYSNSSPTISDCTITGNSSIEGGGGIYCSNSSPTISDCTITGNTAYSGGGIVCNANSSPTISDCTITGNTADIRGGGIYCTLFCYATITGCTISGNSANSGGGIACYSNGDPTISGCTITGNTANFAGGIFIDQSEPIISDSIICGNAPDQINGSYNASETCIEQICDTCTADPDDDGVPDFFDQCPGYDDNADADGDGTPDGCDKCPGYDDNADADGDGTIDCLDGCPDDPLKTEPGICGCNVAETTVIGDLDCDGDYDIDDAYAAMTNFGITTGTPGDVNADGTVDTSDLDELRTSLDLCASDTDMDGDTDIEDLLKVISSWGNSCTP